MTEKEKKNEVPDILNSDLYKFREGFRTIRDLEASAEFSYKLIKNMKLVEAEIKILDEIIKPSDDYTKKYQPEVEKIAKKYCKNDKDGNPLPRIAPNGAPLFDFTPENKKIFDKKIEDLEKKDEFKDLVEERKKQLEKYQDLQQMACTVPFVKIPFKILPEKITPSQLSLLFELIEE